MDNTVWEGAPQTHTQSSSHNNAIEEAWGIGKACCYLSAPGTACLTPSATSEASFEYDSDSDSESENAGSIRLRMAIVGFEPELADKGKGPA